MPYGVLPIRGGITELINDVLAGPGSGVQAALVVGLQGFPVAPTAPALGEVLTWNGAAWAPLPGGGGSVSVSQANTFVEGQAVYFDGALWQAAQSNAAGTLGLGIATSVTPAGFTVVFSGPITLPGLYPLESGPGPLMPGQYYFVSASVAGTLTAVQPTGLTEYSNPLVFALSPTEAVVLPFRPSAISSSGGTFRPYDANVVYAWKCDSISPNGLTVPAAVGAVNLTAGSPSSVETGWCFSNTPSFVGPPVVSTVPSVELSSGANLLINQASLITLECVMYFDAFWPGWQNPNGYFGLFLGNPSSVPGAGVLLSFQLWNRDTPNLFLGECTASYAGAFPFSQISYGGGLAQIQPGVPHHLMATWDNTNTVRYYIDGALFPAGPNFPGARTAPFTSLGINIPPGVSWGDIRISNVVRDQNYAIEATYSMRSM